MPDSKFTAKEASPDYDAPQEKTVEPSAAFTIDDLPRLRRTLTNSQLDATALRSLFHAFLASRDHFVADLIERYDEKALCQIAGRLGHTNAKQSSEEANATYMFRSSLAVFALDDSSLQPNAADFENEIRQTIERWTAEDVRARVAWLTDQCGYPWPANRLTVEDARGLRGLSNQLNRPMNQLVKEAVEQYVLLLSSDQQ